ncbi:MAG: hypothetical protein GKS06_03580 [Acidobacteria bacterium]|nr:hypothetical protein [Acidobacteriota bacterium]
MQRTLALTAFELRYYLRRISTWAYFAVLVAVSFLMMSVFGGAVTGATASIGGTDGTVFVNSPFVLMTLISIFSIFGTLVVAAVSGNAGYRDFGEKMHPLVFTTTTSKTEFIVSRFVGITIVNAVVLSGIGAGLWLGSLSPFVRPELFGPNRLVAYLQPYLLIVIPNVLFASAIFFSMALLTRKRLPHYLGGAGMLLGYLIAGSLGGDLERKWIGVLVDPFGGSAFGLVTEYWTPIEKNTQILGLEGWLLWNRLLWVAVAVAIVAVAATRLRFSQSAGEGRKRRVADESEASVPLVVATRIELPPTERTFGWRADMAQLRALTTQGFREVILSPYFFAILMASALFLVMSAMQLETIFGTRTWPMAWKVIEVLGGSYGLFVVILLTLYSGELVWRERDLKLDQIVDSTPTRSWVAFASKLIALCAVVLILLVVVTFAGLLTQSVLGFFRFELGLYMQKLFGMQLIDYVLLAIFSLAVHTVVNHKYTGHFLLILFYVGIDLLPLMGIEHSLWRYGSDLGQSYSDMNQHGWFLDPFMWFKAYWAGFAILLAVLSNLLWPRGVDGRIRGRLSEAKLRARTASLALGCVGGFLAVGAGGYVFYNTNVLNEFTTSVQAERAAVAYETTYKQYEDLPQPRITAVSLEVDLYPREGDVSARGTYRFINRTEVPIPAIHVLIDDGAEVRDLTFAGGAEMTHEDLAYAYRIFELTQPLQPGQESTLTFDLFCGQNGFAHSLQNQVVENGTFVNSGVLPSFGYAPGGELSLDRTREKYGLEPKARMADLDDEVARNDNYISRDADWVDFEVVLSTSADQIALAPGYIQREWEEDGRRYYHYAMDAPILNFFSFLSARYEVVRDSWNDVAIEVYYHPGHEFNLDRMVDGVKKLLEYFSREFSPYQHRQMRILEFPRYASFAQSFPNTVPYSESIGFIARVGEDDIDYPFYVTAHEVAHQWWAHQVIGGNLQGSTVLSETLAQYSALMLMEQEFGADKIRRFLAFELDNYLQGRSFETKKEVPLLRVENQPYIHYRKGSLIMYAIRDAIGEDAVNRALANLLDEWAFQGPPYPTSRALLEALLAETPDDLKAWVSDLFEHIVIYDNRATAATARPIEDGRYEVTLTFESRKLLAGEQGEETEAILDDPIDIGVFDADENPLYFEKLRIDSSMTEITVVVDGLPARAGIDPYNKLIDRFPDDNDTRVEIATQP